MRTIDRPVWQAVYGNVWRAEWHGMELLAGEHSWELHRNGERLTGGYWRQLPGQRPASAATRLEQNKHAAYAAAFRRVANGD